MRIIATMVNTVAQENAREAQALLIREGAATGRLQDAEATDALLMLTCTAAIARGATPLEIQRNVNYFNGID